MVVLGIKGRVAGGKAGRSRPRAGRAPARAAWLVVATALLGWGAVAPGGEPDVAGGIARLRINAGPYAGAYREFDNTTNTEPIRWYSASRGLYGGISAVPPGHVRDYLDAFLRHTNQVRFFTDDVNTPLATPTIVVNDGDNSNAALFLMLVNAYWERSGDRAWLDANLPLIKAIGYYNILASPASSDSRLVATFSSRRTIAGVPEAKRSGKFVGTMFNNCECYRACHDFADLLRDVGDPDYVYYRQRARDIAAGILSLYSEADNAFRLSTHDGVRTTEPATTDPAYPAWLIEPAQQVAPQLYGVDLGARTDEYYAKGWAYLNMNIPDWYNCNVVARPLNFIGAAGAIRADARTAGQIRVYSDRYQIYLYELFVNNRDVYTQYGSILELGDFGRIRNPQQALGQQTEARPYGDAAGTYAYYAYIYAYYAYNAYPTSAAGSALSYAQDAFNRASNISGGIKYNSASQDRRRAAYQAARYQQAVVSYSYAYPAALSDYTATGNGYSYYAAYSSYYSAFYAYYDYVTE